ncbi:TPA: hypothetical protein ACKRPP_001174 [Proteus mirabilis]
MDKSRQQFEKKFYNKFNFELTSKGNYRYFSTNIAWEAWQASRESLEVELPDKQPAGDDATFEDGLIDGHNSVIDDFKQILISNGVKINDE